MNSDFWPSRGPLSGNNFHPMVDASNEYHQRNQQATTGFHNNNNASDNNDVDLKDHLMAGQDSQIPFNQTGIAINQQQQQQPAPVASPSVESSSPESKFNAEKFVNEIQVNISNISLGLVIFWRAKI